MRRFMNILVAAILILGLQFTARGQERDRSKVADKYKWNLSEIYPSDDAWKSAKGKLVSEISTLERFRGTVTTSPANLLNCLSEVSRLSKDYARLASYAHMISDQDTRESKYLAMQQEMGQVGSTFGAATAFIEPEILKGNRAAMEEFVRKEGKLEVYRHYLDDLLRRQAHTGTEGEEKIIADAGLIARSPQNIYSTFSNADFPYPTITLSDGRDVKLEESPSLVVQCI